MKNYYTILKINGEADLAAIKKAFRREIALYHPDKNPNESAKQHFDDLVEGFNILSDSEKRKVYDAMLKASYTNKPIVVSEKQQYEEWKEESKKTSRKYRSTTLEDLLLLDIFLDVGFSGLLTEDLFDGVGDLFGDVFDLF